MKEKEKKKNLPAIKVDKKNLWVPSYLKEYIEKKKKHYFGLKIRIWISKDDNENEHYKINNMTGVNMYFQL